MMNQTTASIIEGVSSAEAVRQEERRAEVRKSYPVKQFVAFHDPSQTPTKEMFREVLCQDISTSGMSFYLTDRPTADHCTIALGRTPGLIFVRAKVIHSGPYLGPNKEWVIGCQFLSKVEKPV